MKKPIFNILILFFLISLKSYSQYNISGFIKSGENRKTIYLSLLKYNEENAIYPEQIIITTITDSTGHFEFNGQLLANENKLYRIHSNLNEETKGLEFYENGMNKNYHNFIFSNSDTLFFPQDNDVWFSHSKNTNSDDGKWRKSIKYELSLLEEYSKTQNPEALIQTEKKFLNELKSYCTDSLSNPLVKLLAFSHIKRNVTGLRMDFKNDPDFYYNLQDKLNEYYSGTSYYFQFKEEISKLSASIINQKYIFHKRLNYLLGIIVLLLFVMLLFVFRKLKINIKQITINDVSTLTVQEEKIAKLICDGMINKEIATKLFISLSTVKTHIGSLYSKMDVINRQQLIEKLKNHTWD